jgi:triacylglycerol esterase/lipase EstA (alpha/beta hydrolase family)
MTYNILAIHGAFSTPLIFGFLKRELNQFNWKFVDYPAHPENIQEVLNRAIAFDPGLKTYHVVGHSMGGLVALSLSNLPWVKSITTIATPLGGIDLNPLQRWLNRSQFLNEITGNSKLVKRLQSQQYPQPIQHIVTTKGFNPWLWEDNDGVVTLRSQRHWCAGAVIEVSTNHSEAMMHTTTAQILRDFWTLDTK